MAAAESVPFRTATDGKTVVAAAYCAGKRFVNVADDHPLQRIGDNPWVTKAAPGGPAYGISAHEITSGKTGLTHTAPGLEVPVVADGPIGAGSLVEVGTDGKAKQRATGFAVGLAVSAAADGEDVRVQIR
jgi:hypothetical protein